MISTVSAPGKLMLFGEHAVVYDRHCLVTAVGQRLHLQAEQITSSDLEIDAVDTGVTGYKKPILQIGKGEIPKGVKFVEFAIRNFSLQYPIKTGIRIKTKSEFSPKLGFGSSSAAAVCTVKALSELFDRKLSNDEIFTIAYKTVLDIQGKGSGYDVAAAVYGGTLYYLTGGKEIMQLDVEEIPLIVGYTGVKADTTTLVEEVSKKAEIYGDIIEQIYNNCETLVLRAKESLEKKDWKSVGELMDFNQGYLEALGVSSPKLSTMIYAARAAGAYGAKLSGAGGGDCMIAIANEKKITRVAEALKDVSEEVPEVATGVAGVRLEEKML